MKGIGRKAVALLVSASLLVLSACGSDSKPAGSSNQPQSQQAVKIGYLPITHAGPLYLEDELAKQGLDGFKLELVKFGSWPDLMDALNTGKIDGASVLIELAMKAKEQGIDLKAVALGHKDGNVVITANDIGSVKELKGKSFAIPHKFSSHNILLHQMLSKAGMKYSDVNVVELPPAEMPAALSEGRISGYIVAEPFGAKSVAISKGKVLFQSEDLWLDSICCALILRNAFIQSNESLTQTLVNQYVKAGGKAELKDAEVKKTFKTYMNVDDKVLDLSLNWIHYDDLRLSEQAYEDLRKNMIEAGISAKPPTFEDFVDNTFIDKAA